jgi:nitronate monooxygenase
MSAAEPIRQRAARLTGLLGVAQPIVGAPMAGASTPALVAAVSNGGGLGSLPCAILPPAQIEQAIRSTRELTNKPFAINLFITPTPQPQPREIEAMQTLLDRYRAELGIASPPLPSAFAPDFAEQFDVVLAADVPVFSFTFGALDRRRLDALRVRGTRVIGTATCVKEARMLDELGVDAIAAQGFEAGAHRGTFAVPMDDAQVGLFALLPQMAAAVDVPVIAAGAIASGAGVAAALLLGACGAQIGTAFLRTPECMLADAHKAQLAQATDIDTRLTRAFSGRHARGIANRLMDEVESSGLDIPPYPIQNALTRDLRQAAGKQGRAEFLSLWAGQAASLARAEPAGVVMQRIVNELQQLL